MKFSKFFFSSNKNKEYNNNLIIVNQYFPPDFASTGQLLEELARSFQDENFNINVLTGMPAYYFNTKFANSYESEKNLNIKRSRLSRLVPKRYKGKIINSLLFCLRVLTHTLFLRKENTIILYTSEPAFLPIFGWLFSKLLNTPYIILIYDIYPEILVNLKLLKKDNLIIKIWRFFNKLSFDRAREIIVLSSSMKEIIRSNYSINSKKINIIPCWADPKLINPIPREKNDFLIENNLNDYFIVLYSGNQGRCHDLITLINAATILKENKKILFLFVGNGFQNEFIKRECSNNLLSNCRFLPFQEKEKLPYLLSSASIGVVSLNKEIIGLIAPSKLYGHLASGTPIAAISGEKSFLKEIIEKNDCGKWFNNGDYQGLAKWIVEMQENQEKLNDLGKASFNLFLQEFTINRIKKKYLKVLKRNFPSKK